MKFSEARAKVAKFGDLELFRMFSVDVKVAARQPHRNWTENGPIGGHCEVSKVSRDTKGGDLWDFRNVERSNKTVNVKAMTAEELARVQKKEKADRARTLSGIYDMISETVNWEDDDEILDDNRGDLFAFIEVPEYVRLRPQ